MRANRGFTLIELVMVIVILGVLASMALPKFTGAKEAGEKSVADAAIASVAAAAANCYAAKREKCSFAEITGSTYLTLKDVSIVSGGGCSSFSVTAGSTTVSGSVSTNYCS